jgi:hypothetical protein
LASKGLEEKQQLGSPAQGRRGVEHGRTFALSRGHGRRAGGRQRELRGIEALGLAEGQQRRARNAHKARRKLQGEELDEVAPEVVLALLDPLAHGAGARVGDGRYLAHGQVVVGRLGGGGLLLEYLLEQRLDGRQVVGSEQGKRNHRGLSGFMEAVFLPVVGQGDFLDAGGQLGH